MKRVKITTFKRKGMGWINFYCKIKTGKVVFETDALPTHKSAVHAAKTIIKLIECDGTDVETVFVDRVEGHKRTW